MQITNISKTKKGDLVRLIRRNEACQRVWIRGDYYRPEKAYVLQAWDDVGRYMMAKGSRLVATDFEF
jgi:hypothetical protein